MQRLRIELGERSYPILIGPGLRMDAAVLDEAITARDLLVVSNTTVAPLYLADLQRGLGGRRIGSLLLPDGEQHKTLDSMSRVLDALVEGRYNRDAAVVALGGGVVGDLAGFAAACYQRGVDFVQVPTTLLAQVDSAVGGKTGVNHPGGKNLIGAFHQPRAVISDTDTLRTLPSRELRGGLAEVIKYGLLADAAFLAWLEANLDALLRLEPAALEHAIRRCCEIKAGIVAEDEREHGRRALLNLGHTFGHTIETAAGYGEWLHGEAVAAGMVMAAQLSGLPDADLARLRKLIASAGLPVAPPRMPADELLAAMGRDKKVQGKALRFVLLRELGDARLTSDYDEAALQRICAAAA